MSVQKNSSQIFDELESLSTKQLQKILIDFRSQSDMIIENHTERKKEIMKLLHEFNDVKDATQVILSVLAQKRGVLLKNLHLTYNLPLCE